MSRYDTFWRRFWAGIIDAIVFAPLGWLQDACVDNSTSRPSQFVWSLAVGFSPIIYSVLMHARLGQTLGKMVAHVEVLDVSEERRMTLGQSCRRDIGLIVAQACCAAYELATLLLGFEGRSLSLFATIVGWASLIWFLLEVATILTNEKRRALHDWIAGSVVVVK